MADDEAAGGLPWTLEERTPDGRVLRYCLYGPVDGFPVVFHSGSPGTRWKRPDVVAGTAASGIRLLVLDRPGYGGSTRRRGRSVADVVTDVECVTAARGWDRFAVAGGSGGGPHALACAAGLPGRVTRCAVAGAISPPDTSGPRPAADDPDSRRNPTSWLAARGEDQIRPLIGDLADQVMAGIAAGAPEFPPDPETPRAADTQPALDDPAAMARLRATFVDSHDGWVDDNIAFARPWGFDLADITVPVSLWLGTTDPRGRDHARWLHTAIPHAELREYPGGHLQPDATYRQMLTWLR